MRIAAVVIGVNRTGGMPVLGGAVAGAVDFAQWAETQGIEVSLFTDAGDAVVTADAIHSAVRDITEARVYSRLIIYFGGHGFLTSPGSEVWLLSGAPDPETEAVNLRLSQRIRSVLRGPPYHLRFRCLSKWWSDPPTSPGHRSFDIPQFIDRIGCIGNRRVLRDPARGCGQ